MKNKLSGRGLVIEPGAGKTRIALMTLGKKPAQFHKQIVIDTPPGAFDDGVILQPDAFREALHAAIRENKLQGVRKAVFSVSSTQVLTGTAVIPNVDRRWLTKMINTNRDIYFPVNTAGHQISYALQGTVNDGDGKVAFSVRLWAVPSELLRTYYEVANACGLSLEAVDYCGNSFAAAINADYSLGTPAAGKRARKSTKAKRSAGKRKGSDAAAATATVERTEEKSETAVYLMAREEYLMMTLVRDGHVVGQRCLRRGNAYFGELEEARFTLELYQNDPETADSPLRGVLLGDSAQDVDYFDDAGRILGIPISAPETGERAEWLICAGAAATQIDFGIPTLNKPKRYSAASQVWQYGFVAAGGAIAVYAALALTAPVPIRNSEVTELEASRDNLQSELAGVQNYQSRWNDYEQAYEDYKDDWALFMGSDSPVTDESGEPLLDSDGNPMGRVYMPGVLRSYNDNIRLILEDLEKVLPTTSSVTELRIEEDAVAIQVASETKLDSVNLLLALRYNMTYAELYADYISDLTQGQGVSVFDSPVSTAISQARGSLEEAPETGSSGDDVIRELWPDDADREAILDLLATLPQEDQDFIIEMAKRGKDGTFTSEEIEHALRICRSLTPAQRQTASLALGYDTRTVFSMDKAMSGASVEERADAMYEMLHNPVAVYCFGELVYEDLNRPTTEQIFFPSYYDDLYAVMTDPNVGDIIEALKGGGSVSGDGVTAILPLIPFLMETPTDPANDYENLKAAEALIATGDEAGTYYAYYLAVARGWDPMDASSASSGGGNTGGGSTGGNESQNPGGNQGGNESQEPGGNQGGNENQEPGENQGGNESQNPGGNQGGNENQGGSENTGKWYVDPATNLPVDPATGKPVNPATDPRFGILAGMLDSQYHLGLTTAVSQKDWTKVDWSGVDWDTFEPEQYMQSDLSGLMQDPNILYIVSEVFKQDSNTGESGGTLPFDPSDILQGITGGGEEEEPADTRWYLTFVLTYSDKMLNRELEHKGLDRKDIVPELDRGEATGKWDGTEIFDVVGDVSCDTDGYFNRSGAMRLIAALLALEDKGDISGYKDVPADSVFAEAVAKCIAQGVAIGTSEEKMDPMRPIDRESMVEALANALGVADGVDGLLELAGISEETFKSLGPLKPVTASEFAIFVDGLIGAYIRTDGAHEIAGDGKFFTLVTAKDAALTGAYNGTPIVICGKGARVDVSGVEGSAEYNVVSSNVSIDGAPAGTVFNLGPMASGLKVNGSEVGNVKQYTVPESAGADGNGEVEK